MGYGVKESKLGMKDSRRRRPKFITETPAFAMPGVCTIITLGKGGDSGMSPSTYPLRYLDRYVHISTSIQVGTDGF